MSDQNTCPKTLGLDGQEVVHITDSDGLGYTTDINEIGTFVNSKSENANNKVSVFQSTPDNIHYASEKLTKDNLDLKVSKVTPLGEYHYYSSTSGDAVGDTRTSNQSGWQVSETCITAHATRGAGTWIVGEIRISKRLATNGYIDTPVLIGSFFNFTIHAAYLNCQGTWISNSFLDSYTYNYGTAITLTDNSPGMRITNLSDSCDFTVILIHQYVYSSP